MKAPCLATFAAFCLAFSFAFSGCQSGGSEPPPKPKFALASANVCAPPMAWLEDGELKGAGIDIAKIALSAIELEPRIRVEGSWSEVLEKARDGRIDMVIGAYKTAARQEYLVFSEPYYTEPVAVCVKKGKEFPFSRKDDLKGHKGVLGLGESYGEDFDSFAKSSLTITRETMRECFADLVSGKADYLVVSLQSGMIASWQYGFAEDVVFLDIPVTSQNYHLAFSKKSPFAEDMPRINQRLLSMRIDGTPERLVAKYLISWKNRFILHSPTDIPNIK